MPYEFLFYITVLKKRHQQFVVQIFKKVPANIVLLTSIQFSSAGEHIPWTPHKNENTSPPISWLLLNLTECYCNPRVNWYQHFDIVTKVGPL